MRKRIIVIMTSSILAFFIMSGGYGLWKRTLKIEGSIHVAEPKGVPPTHSFALLSMENADSVTGEVYSKNVKYEAKTVTQDVYSDDTYENITETRVEFGDKELLEFIKEYKKIND